jgi:hypothetical protein
VELPQTFRLMSITGEGELVRAAAGRGRAANAGKSGQAWARGTLSYSSPYKPPHNKRILDVRKRKGAHPRLCAGVFQWSARVGLEGNR